MKKITFILLLFSCTLFAQKKTPVYDDFGGQSTISWWAYSVGESVFTTGETDPKRKSNSVGLFYKNKEGNKKIHHGMGANFNEKFSFKNKSKFTFRLYISNRSAVTRVKDKKVRFILKNSEDESNFAYVEETFEMGEWQTIVFDMKGKTDQNGKPIEKSKSFDMIVIEFLTDTKVPGKFYIDDFSFGNDLKENAD